MNKEIGTQDTYETPKIEIIAFELTDSIAVSGESVSGLICGEEIK
jgi:hypothetical protein